VATTREMAILTRYYASILKGKLKVQSESYYSDLADKMTKTIYEHGWDGAWFLRAFDDLGQKVGSADCKEGKIFIETQGFSVLAGIGLENGFAKESLESVHNFLSTEHGIMLLQPAYTQYHLNLGEISSYPPGVKENGGVFCHNNPWVMIAETKAGNGDRAFDYYARLNPSAREKLASIHRCEPYVYAQMIAGKDAPNYGEAKNSWLTGAASWNYVAITQHILGIRPTYDGLEIKPCVPSSWTHFKAIRRFRGAIYHIAAERGKAGLLESITVDGKRIDGSVIPPARTGSVVNVNVVFNN